LLNHALHNREGRRVAVIVNDMSEVNVDAQLVRNGGAELNRVDERLIEMSNGCICCTLREDLLDEVARLARERRFDYLLIESTGISEPLPVAATFALSDELGAQLGELARLDTMVTVVDGPRFSSRLRLRRRPARSRAGGRRRRRPLHRRAPRRSGRARQCSRAQQDRQDEREGSRTVDRDPAQAQPDGDVRAGDLRADSARPGQKKKTNRSPAQRRGDQHDWRMESAQKTVAPRVNGIAARPCS